MIGADGDDLLVGSEGNDSIGGGPRNDVLYGAGGDDELSGAPRGTVRRNFRVISIRPRLSGSRSFRKGEFLPEAHQEPESPA